MPDTWRYGVRARIGRPGVGIMIMTMIALKSTTRHLLSAPRTVFNTYVQVARAQSCTNHVQHIERLSRATCRVPRGTKGQLSC